MHIYVNLSRDFFVTFPYRDKTSESIPQIKKNLIFLKNNWNTNLVSFLLWRNDFIFTSYDFINFVSMLLQYTFICIFTKGNFCGCHSYEFSWYMKSRLYAKRILSSVCLVFLWWNHVCFRMGMMFFLSLRILWFALNSDFY